MTAGAALADLPGLKRGGDELAEQIAHAEATFWCHVREALQTIPLA